jgi:hypothetical protein
MARISELMGGYYAGELKAVSLAEKAGQVTNEWEATK